MSKMSKAPTANTDPQASGYRLGHAAESVLTILRMHDGGLTYDQVVVLETAHIRTHNRNISNERIVEMVTAAVGLLIRTDSVTQANGRLYISQKQLADDERDERAQVAELSRRIDESRAMVRVQGWPGESVAHKYGGPIALIVSVALVLSLCLWRAKAFGADVPDWAIRGIAAVETGAHWYNTGNVRGTWSANASGDVSPWHLSRAVLKDYGLTDKRTRIDTDTVYAESIVRMHLLNLYAKTKCWSEAVAAYRAGLGGRHKSHARDYAERAQNYGETYR